MPQLYAYVANESALKLCYSLKNKTSIIIIIIIRDNKTSSLHAKRDFFYTERLTGRLCTFAPSRLNHLFLFFSYCDDDFCIFKLDVSLIA